MSRQTKTTSDPGAMAYAEPKELVVFRGRRRVTWIGVPESAGNGSGVTTPPDVPTRHNGRGNDHGACPLESWFEDSCAEASHALLYGPNADSLVRLLGRAGNTPQVVRCSDRADALRTARVLACPGDTVLASSRGALILPSTEYYWHQD